MGKQIPITEQLANVEEKIKQIKGGSVGDKRTSGKLDLGDGVVIDIDNPKNEESLIMATAAVMGRNELYNRAADSLGLKTYPAFTLNGATADRWVNDIKISLNRFKNKEIIKRLEAVRDELKACITKEDRRAKAEAEFAEIMASGLPQLGKG